MHDQINIGPLASSANTNIPISLEDHLSNVKQENLSESHHIERTEHKQKDVNIQTSLSAKSPRKFQLLKTLTRAQSKIRNLEIIKKEKHMDINMDVLDMAVDKFFPPETAHFLKAQARLFQKFDKGRKYTPAFKQQCLYKT
ncbi:PREDICTED: uncharacterized protein LOC108777647 isoform X2 [Cyphomyrmex costatus]|nr:PREDICTED: uncharacterized protein LOC108777647 isoform X2 [Cyphomyrmex costatus]